MGLKPKAVRAMTFTDFAHCFIAFREANRPGRGPVTDAEYEALEELGERWNAQAKAAGQT